MTALAAVLTLSLLVPQDKEAQKGDPRMTSVLSASEQKSLNDKMRAWFDAEIDVMADQGSKRDALRKKAKDTLDQLEKEWGKLEKAKGDPVKHLGDMRAVFNNVIPYKSQTGSGEVKVLKVKDKSGKETPVTYGLVVPKGYRETSSYRAVIALPGHDPEKKLWIGAKDWFDKTWRGPELADSTMFLLPSLENELDYDGMPDPTKDGDTALESRRVEALFLMLFTNVYRDYRLDFDRLLLDCGKGNCGFGLRLATYFPSRFAGLILRHPVDAEGLRLDSLTGVPVLLLSSPDTKAACDKIAKTLNDLQAGACTVLEGKGSYPFLDSRPEIAEWAKKAQRDLFRSKVTIVPTSNKFRTGYWVRVGVAEQIGLVPDAQRPLISVEADAKENRITVNARSIGDFSLSLNDAIVDLDKEVTIVVNGVAEKVKPQRNWKKMCEQMQKLTDPTLLFPYTYVKKVPKVEEKKGEKSEGEKDK